MGEACIFFLYRLLLLSPPRPAPSKKLVAPQVPTLNFMHGGHTLIITFGFPLSFSIKLEARVLQKTEK